MNLLKGQWWELTKTLWKGVFVARENHGVKIERFCCTQESAPDYKGRHIRKWQEWKEGTGRSERTVIGGGWATQQWSWQTAKNYEN